MMINTVRWKNILCDTGFSLPDVCRFFYTDNSGRILDFFSGLRRADERGSLVDPCREKVILRRK